MSFAASWLRLSLCAALLSAAGCAGSSIVGERYDAGDDLALDVPSNADGSVDAAPDTAPCTSNADCAANEPGRRVCDRASGRCVACVATDDTCPAAQHCDPATRQCVDGCRTDEGCTADPARRCNVPAHACVQCLRDDQCMPGTVCSMGRCEMGCNATQACPTGRACCAGACLDLQSNNDSCGACGRRCELANATATCAAGACAVASCTVGFRDCDGMAATGCETDTRTAVAHCGGCGMACAARPNTVPSCADGACRYACEVGFGDCDGDASNGCETDTRTATGHCGGCGMVCSHPFALSVCVVGACVMGGCDSGHANCDGETPNGCETETNASLTNCGGCGLTCRPANATSACTVGVCSLTTCNAGFADCDRAIANGCEVDTRTSLTNCGACGTRCPAVNATATCAMGVCGIGACTTGFANCNGLLADGCELNLASVGFAPAGIVTTFALAGSGTNQTPVEAISVAVGPSDNVYVLSYTDKIIVFDRDGNYVRNFPRLVWNAAYDLAVDRASGQMWVVDPATNQVVHLTAAGAPAETWTAGVGPRGIAFAGGEVFVSDAGGNRVLVFSPTGTPLRTIITMPPMQAPRGLAVGASGNLYVSSFTDNTVRIMASDGAPLRTVPVVPNPSDVVVDECRGMFYVLGEASDQWAQYRISDGVRMYAPLSTAGGTSHAGLALSADGSRLYVARNHGASRGVAMYLR